ncbi:MAG TPA: CAP domain-containing protein [Devosiaceae bacterium]
MNGLDRRSLLIGGAAMLAGATVLPVGAFAAAVASPPPAEMVAAVNALRKRYRVGPLALNDRLQRHAEYQARLMAERDTLSHDLGPGLGLRERSDKFGYHGVIGENVAAGYRTLSDVLDGWMASQGHRRNLLRPNFSEFGLAYATLPRSRKARQHIYWAMEFGGHTID